MGIVPVIAFAGDPVGLVTQLKTPFVVEGVKDTVSYFAVTNDAVTLGFVRTHLNTEDRNGASVSFDVGMGKSLTIEKLIGGRGRTASFTKTGDGTLTLKDAATYGGTLKLAGGTLALAGRKVPTADELPASPYLHVDASDLSNLETNLVDGTTYVTYWKNNGVGMSGTEQVTGLRPFAYDEHPTYFRPWLVKDALGPGLHTVDFGVWRTGKSVGGERVCEYCYNAANVALYGETWPVRCGAMTFAKSKTANVTTLPKNFRTVIALVGAQRGGGVTLGCSTAGQAYETPYDRCGSWIGGEKWTSGICGAYKKNGVTYPVELWQDGRRAEGESRYDSPGYHVVAMKQDPGDFSFQFIGGRAVWYGPVPGGPILGEVFIYDRDLSETEIRDVSAYLMYKWFKLTAGGYAKPDGQANLQRVLVAEDSAITIPAGETNRIDTLTLNAKLTVKGGGTLEVFDATIEGDIAYEDGSEIRYADRPDTDLLAAIPPGQSLRLDAQALGSLTMKFDSATGTNVLASGTNKIVTAVSYGGGNMVAISSGGVSYVPEFWNGQPMIDFGWSTVYGQMFNTYPMDGVRSVFLAYRGDSAPYNVKIETHTHDGGYTIGGHGDASFLLGTDTKNSDFFRDVAEKGSTTAGNRALVGNNNCCLGAGYGSAYLNGVKWTNGPTGDFDEIEMFGEKCSAHCSAIKCALGRSQYAGGGQLGELLIYERLLTARERIQLRNYMNMKWFGKTEEELTPLPAKPASKAGLIPPTVIEVAGETRTLGETTASNLVFRGYGTVVKQGAATTIQTTDFNGFTGTVTVTEGTLGVTGYPLARRGKRHEENLIARFVADEGLVTEQSGDVTKIKEWHSTVGDYYLVRAVNSESVCVGRDGYRRQNYVNLGEYGMYIYTNGVATSITNIRAVAWALGSQTGGGSLMGGDTVTGNGNGIGWHRGNAGSGTPGYDYLDPLLNLSYAQTALKSANAMWRVNDQTANPETAHLTGGWDAIGVNETNTAAAAINARTVAIEPRSGGIRQGHMRLFELALYSEPMTEEEFLDNEAYLMNTWRLQDAIAAGTNQANLVLLPGTTLSAGGHSQYFKSLAGAGATVTDGGVRPQTYVYDFANAGTLVVDGTFEFLPGFTVELRNAPGYFEPVTIVTATSLEGLANYTKACVTGSPGGPVLAWLWDGENALYKLVVRFEGMNVSGDVVFTNATDLTFAVTGEGSVTKSGAGALILRGFAGFNGTLHVAEGSMSIGGTPVAVTPNLPLNGRLAHFDANLGLDLACQSTGIRISKWTSQVGNFYAAGSAAYDYVMLLPDELNYQPVLKLNNGMLWKDGSSNTNLMMEGIQTVLWVIGSQEGGGFILGGGRKSMDPSSETGYAWHRAEPCTDPASAILHIAGSGEVTSGALWTNNVLVATTATPFSGDYQQIAWRSSSDEKWATASAFASDTRGVTDRQGYQRLAEVVLYNRRLSEGELASANAYLNLKWGLDDAVPQDSSTVDLVVDAGATVDLGGTNRAVRSVGGAGTITCDVRSSGMTFDFDNPTTLTINGKFAFGAGFTVMTTGTPTEQQQSLKILVTDGFEDVENYSRTAVTGVAANRYALIKKSDNCLYLRKRTNFAIMMW